MSPSGQSSAEILLQKIVQNSVRAVKPSTLFENHFKLSGESLNAFGHNVDLKNRAAVKCVGIGKSAEAMSYEVRKRLGGKVSGIIATPVERHIGVEGFEFFKTGHPYPDEISVEAGKRVEQFVKSCHSTDLLLFLVSGGGSASVFVPVEGVSLNDCAHLIRTSLDAGIPIDQLNLLRRHLSRLGGGKLAGMTKKSEKLSLILSDVVGDDLPSIASGPTVPDITTPADAYRFLIESDIADRIPNTIPAVLQSLSQKFASPQLSNNFVRIIASNSNAITAADNEAIENGFNSIILTRFLEMDAEAAAPFLVSIARMVEQDGIPVPTPAVILFGGETTVKVTGGGKGGRNQHFMLTALRELVGLRKKGTSLNRTTIFSFGTDGKDGNSNAAGAYISPELTSRFADRPETVREYLGNNDSNTFFAQNGGLITTGPTDTNVMDISGIIVA